MKARKEIKVANVIMEGRYGGPQARITAIAERLKKDDIETIVAFPKKDSDLFYKKLTERNIRTKRLSLHRITRQKSQLIKYFVSFIPELFSLYRCIKREHVDIVHCNASWQIKGIIAGKLAGKKVIWHLNDTRILTLIIIVFKFLARHSCDGFITAGNRVRNCYLHNMNFSHKPVAVIQAPVDTSFLEPEKVQQDEKISSTCGLKIVTIANINPAKGLEYFIKMASFLNQQYSDLFFFVVGAQLESQRKYSVKVRVLNNELNVKNLEFYGPSDNVASVLKATDIYVCSSIAEASPTSVWEAMSMGKAIVSTNVGDVSRFIINGENGFLVPTKNPAALAEKVAILVENVKLRKEFGIRAREVAIKCLDVEICARKHAEFYRKVLGQRG